MASNRHTEKDMAEAGHETTRRAAGHAAQTARTMSDAAERTARTGADVFQRNSEQFRQTVEMGSDAATRIAERAFGVTGNGAQQTTQQSARNVEAILHSSAIIADGVQTIAREWLSFAQNRAERNMERFEALSNSRSVQDFVATHTDLVRDHLQDLLQTTKRVAEVSTRMVDEAVQTGDSTLAPR